MKNDYNNNMRLRGIIILLIFLISIQGFGKIKIHNRYIFQFRPVLYLPIELTNPDSYTLFDKYKIDEFVRITKPVKIIKLNLTQNFFLRIRPIQINPFEQKFGFQDLLNFRI